ncbi:MAG: NifB/NifX family molybdenum-iron cluster-binding protein [Bacilli bacterium]|nr:NifB/NifX family molybdenum-iron cluster-binding protein [Bacilli bacterium]MBN2696196.1 NifB/NifX family molybdenum-iron cluster-binding protein [Bacilli bacterium]
MIIALPSDEKHQSAPINGQFGRARYFCLFDSGNNSYRFIDNPAINAPGGAGVRSSSELVNLGVDSVVAFRVGDNALRVLERNNISIYSPIRGSIEDNVSALVSGRLNLLFDNK